MGKNPEDRRPTDIIEATKHVAGCKSNTDIADRLGMLRQTLAHKRKYPSTFTCGEILSLTELFRWDNDTIGEFIRSCRD